MGVKDKYTNEQLSASGMKREDNGNNQHLNDKNAKKRKKDKK